MTIHIVSRTTDYQVRNENADGGYRTVKGEVERTILDQSGSNVLDGMIHAQSSMGQITWYSVADNIARGFTYNHQHGGNDRVVVIEHETADVSDVIDAVISVFNAS